jgi:hypothetical protein
VKVYVLCFGKKRGWPSFRHVLYTPKSCYEIRSSAMLWTRVCWNPILSRGQLSHELPFSVSVVGVGRQNGALKAAPDLPPTTKILFGLYGTWSIRVHVFELYSSNPDVLHKLPADIKSTALTCDLLPARYMRQCLTYWVKYTTQGAQYAANVTLNLCPPFRKPFSSDTMVPVFLL